MFSTHSLKARSNPRKHSEYISRGSIIENYYAHKHSPTLSKGYIIKNHPVLILIETGNL